MAEPTAGPSTIPVITISTHNQESSDEDSSSSSNASPTLTALETPTSLEPPLSEQVPEPARANEIPTVILEEQQEKAHISSNTPGGSNGTTPPRTEPGAPVSLKRNKTLSKTTKNAPNSQLSQQVPWHGLVVDYAPQKEQAVIFPAKMVYSSPNIPYNNEAWAFQRATGYSDYIGSGFVFININGEKKRKNVKDNTYVRNFYTIRNISEKEAKLFFTQTRKSEPGTVDTGGSNRPTTKSFILADWLLQRIVANLLRLRVTAFDWYWKNLAKYRHHFTTRRLYFLFFILGLMVRRLPFVGSPPILNIQLIRLR
ncbi:hypothetical protein DXG01_010042 [Tephrocybe rancida]|nr:hypothetical protein DXG01_010042 [Tephrocybe rancida]